MAYERKITRAEPGLIVELLDNSGSMADSLPGTSSAKYEWVERDTGHILKELAARSTQVRGDNIVLVPRYYLYLLFYGTEPQVWGDGLMDIQTAVEKYADAGSSLGLGGNLGGTDAAKAMEAALEFLEKVINEDKFRNSFPPIVFHLTDGLSATDARPIVDKMRRLATADGNVLVVNAFIGTKTSLRYTGPDDFPGYATAAEAGPSDDNIRLFEMSSPLPTCMRANLIEGNIFPKLRENIRLFFDVRTREMLKNVIQVVGSMGSQADRIQR